MKKVKNILIDIHNRVSLIGISVVSTLIFGLLLFVGDYGLLTTIFYSLIVFFLLVGLKYSESIIEEKHRKKIEEKYDDDPDWSKYKELKKKFNGA